MPNEFCHWEKASLVFLGYTFACALLLPGLTRRARIASAGGCIAGLAIVFWSASLPTTDVVGRFLLLPAIVLLLGYWTTGLLFRGPMPGLESLLRRFDSMIRVGDTAASIPRALAELLEFAYAAVYLLVPLALLIHVMTTPAELVDRDRFWTVILVTDFICFGLLPWIQTRPPRALGDAAPWRSSFRRFNLRLLGSTSIRVNTCPSGHAAEAVAAALLVTNAPLPVVVMMMLAALAVSAGAVYGRYHYAIDALSGWVVAVVVWAAASA
jgi:PAP2 superfamily